MKTIIITALSAIGISCLSLAEDPEIKDASAIKQALTKTVLIPKGADPKSARVRARNVRRIDLQAIHFKFDSTEIADNESYKQIEQLGKTLADPDLKDCVITLEGHTDDVGEENYNLDLSRRRAETVKRFLITQHHIDASRLQVEGKGKGEPLVKDTSDAARAQNRRVVVIREPGA
ncbi:MAG: OmpA family protein [Verrucomicrobia bacterium]|nr:OmpA family protein [Verrucomicrobiota bacterium]